MALAFDTGARALVAQTRASHQDAGNVANFLLFLTICLLALFMYTAGTTYGVWKYLKHRKKASEALSTDT